MLVIQLRYSNSGMPVTSYYTSHMSLFWTFWVRAPSGFESEWNIQRVRVFSAPWCSHRDYIFSFNLNLDLFTWPLKNSNLTYFNIPKKVQGKSLGFIKSRGTPPPRIVQPRSGSHRRDERAAAACLPWSSASLHLKKKKTMENSRSCHMLKRQRSWTWSYSDYCLKSFKYIFFFTSEGLC